MPNVNFLEQWFDFAPYFSKEYTEYRFSKIEQNIMQLQSVSFTPINNKIYIYNLIGNEVFEFNNEQQICSFRLYLTMPSNIVSFTLPTNIIWDQQPSFTETNSLYMLVFEWNPILNKWLGNQMWKTQLTSSTYTSSFSSFISSWNQIHSQFEDFMNVMKLRSPITHVYSYITIPTQSNSSESSNSQNSNSYTNPNNSNSSEQSNNSYNSDSSNQSQNSSNSDSSNNSNNSQNSDSSNQAQPSEASDSSSNSNNPQNSDSSDNGSSIGGGSEGGSTNSGGGTSNSSSSDNSSSSYSSESGSSESATPILEWYILKTTNFVCYADNQDINSIYETIPLGTNSTPEHIFKENYPETKYSEWQPNGEQYIIEKTLTQIISGPYETQDQAWSKMSQ